MANIVTSFRIVCALALIFCPAFSNWFYIFYLLGGISDVFDGIIARHFKKETKLGAKLDTIADTFFVIIVIVKITQEIYIPIYIIMWIICITLIKFINIIIGFVKHKRFISEHIVINKICGIMMFAIPLCIGRFPWQGPFILIILTCIIATFAAIQEGYYIYIGKEIK